jgi:2'-hydroxyisoflavone reductase
VGDVGDVGDEGRWAVRILVVGGTRFVGRHVVEAALAGGHEVSVFHRGRSGPELFPEARHLVGDRDSDLSELADSDRSWDATVDVCAYVPRQVRQLADALGERGGRYLLVSTTSVYDSSRGPAHDEDAALVPRPDPDTEDVTAQTYGPLKVACEQVAVQAFRSGVTVVRPTYVVGPYDYTHRFTYWVQRLARGGEVLAPEPRGSGLQVIDARDMGSWIVRLLEHDVSGTFHAVSPEAGFTFGDLLDAVAVAVAPPGTTLTWVDQQFLLDAGVTDAELPLWPADDASGVEETADPARAWASGLAPRPVGDTAAELLAAERLDPTPNPSGTGMPPAREAELLAAWHAR